MHDAPRRVATTAPTKDGGFTKFPNHLFACDDLSANGRLVALALFKYARKDDGVCYPSQAALAKDIGKGRKVVNAGIEELRTFGLSTFWKCRSGFSKPILHYNVATLREPVAEESANCSCGSHKRESQNDTPGQPEPESQNDTPVLSRSIILDEPECQNDTISRSREEDLSAMASPEVSDSSSASVPSSVSVEAKPTDSLGNSGSAALPALSGAKLDKRLVNTALLGPSGLRVSDEPTDVEHEAYSIMSLLCSESIPKRKLDALMNKSGVRRAHFWLKWLPRKVAYEYERGRPVANPSGLFIRAIENEWEVDPRWPEFDPDKHTSKAAEAFKRKESRRAEFTSSNDLDAEFDAAFPAVMPAQANDDDSFPF